MEVPTDTPLTEDQAWGYFRDVVLGIEYCKWEMLCFVIKHNACVRCAVLLISL